MKYFKQTCMNFWRTGEAKRIQESDDNERIYTARKQVMKWVGHCCEKLRLQKELISKSFVVTGITPALNGQDNHWIRNEEYLQKLFENYDSDNEKDFIGF